MIALATKKHIYIKSYELNGYYSYDEQLIHNTEIKIHQIYSMFTTLFHSCVYLDITDLLKFILF